MELDTVLPALRDAAPAIKMKWSDLIYIRI